MNSKIEPLEIDILQMEIDQKLPHWLDPIQKDPDPFDAIRNRHRAKWVAEQEKKARQKRWQRVKARAAALLARKPFDESEHPRVPPGSPDGGQFTSGGGGGSSSTPEHPQGELWPGKFPPVPEPATPVKDDDFKDKVKLSGPVASDPKRKADFFRQWDEKVREAPEEFRREFMGGLDGTMNITVDPEGNWSLTGNIIEDGKTIGTYTRDIDFERNTAHSSYFSINKGYTGKDIGKKMLAANIAKYQELGIDTVEVHANIDVGGYAWAKYGYVPSESSWSDLSSSLYDKIGGGGGGYTPESWEELSSDQQDQIKEAWKADTFQEFVDSEIENWRDNGGALDEAKAEMADEFDGTNVPIEHWAWKAVQKWRADHGGELKVTNDEILAATSIDYERDYEGRNDADVTIETVEGLTEDQRADLESALVIAFGAEASRREPLMDPPQHISDNVSEYQNDVWDSMKDRDKFRWAEDNGRIEETQPESESDIDPDDASDIRDLLDSGDPKAIWAIADSSSGKDMLLGTDWSGVLDLNDTETMERFNAYVGKAK